MYLTLNKNVRIYISFKHIYTGLLVENMCSKFNAFFIFQIVLSRITDKGLVIVIVFAVNFLYIFAYKLWQVGQ